MPEAEENIIAREEVLLRHAEMASVAQQGEESVHYHDLPPVQRCLDVLFLDGPVDSSGGQPARMQHAQHLAAAAGSIGFTDCAEETSKGMKRLRILSCASCAFIGFATMVGLLLHGDNDAIITTSWTTQQQQRDSHRSDLTIFDSEPQRYDDGAGLVSFVTLEKPFESTEVSSPHSIQQQQHQQQQRRRRSLSTTFDNNTNGRCQSFPKVRQRGAQQQQRHPIPPAYLATYPGSGSRIARKLVKSLTGLRVQAEFDPSPKYDAVAVQTKYPHRSGALAGWDGDVRRAMMLVRSPLRALPSLFDELYASRRHLPAKFHPAANAEQQQQEGGAGVQGGGEASVAEWVSWRDRMFDTQLASYGEFILYWTKRYGHNERFVLSYEHLTDVATGPEETRKMTEFLGREGMVPTVELDEAPCVWQMMIGNGGGMMENDEEEVAGIMGKRMDDPRRRRRRLDSYIIPHPLSIDASLSPSSRPFTPDQLKAMAATLLRVSEDLYTHSQHLHRMLVGYRTEILDILKSEIESGNTGEGAAQKRARTQSGGGGGGVPPTHNFHIFQISPPGADSPVVANWLHGLFDPEGTDTAMLATTPTMSVIQRDKEVPITATVVTRTNEMNLIGLYKIFKPGFDEVFFVLAKSGTDADRQIDEGVCEYDNLLCIEYDEQSYDGAKGMESMVHFLTDKFRLRFGKFFDSLENPVSLQEWNAVSRLKEMNAVMKAMKKRPIDVVDPKFGVRGGVDTKGNNMDQQTDKYRADAAISNVVKNDPKLPLRRLFYCGSTGSGANLNHSILGIFMVNAFFPEIIGAVPTAENSGTVGDLAILLTKSTINDATQNDFLVYHMHQYCDVDVLTFPGLQLHINHPTHGFSAYGKYAPLSNNIFVIGSHDDGPQSIQLPYAMMKWWVLVKSLGSHTEIDRPTMEKLFVPKARPKNTGKHFLLYVNSHYIAYREMAAHMLSRLGPMHALGSCQGNLEIVPMVVDASRPSRCQPYADETRPPSIIVPENRQNSYFNSVMFQDFRFMLLMEDSNIPGYITERIVDGFMAGTVPIYYGTTQIFDIFNHKAFVYYDINNPQEALNRIKYLEENPDAYRQMLNEPILADGERTIEKYFSFDDSIGNGMLKKRVRKRLGFPV